MKPLTLKNVLIACTVFFSVIACKSKKEASASDAPATGNECRLIVTFISIGAGTDYQAAERLKKYLVEKKLKFETKRFGREGENSYCFPLTEYKEKEQKKIIEEIKGVLGKSELIRYEENSSLKK